MKYAFVLGREPALSIAEILALLKAEGLGFAPESCKLSPGLLTVETDGALDVAFFHALGGSIKMAEVLHVVPDLEDDLFGILSGFGRESMDFGLSAYSDAPGLRPSALKTLALTLKKRLKAEGISARAVLPEGPALTSVQVDKNRMIEKGAEILLFAEDGAVKAARTLAVQAFEEFSGRDFGRPGRDAKSGMLPPKLARLMVNLASGPKDKPLLDPFCGSGTILSEAALLGYRELIASDISEQAVQDTKVNFEWTMKRAGLKTKTPKIFRSDVKFLYEKLPANAAASVATEPYLGPPMRGDESDQKVHFVYLELMGLYRRAFEALAKVLVPGAPVVFAFPVFGSKHVNILREIEQLGFKAEALLPGRIATELGLKTPVGLLYKRPDQKVGRDIYRFRFKG